MGVVVMAASQVSHLTVEVEVTYMVETLAL